MKIKFNATELIAALDVVSIVTPKPVTPAVGAGYLFVVREGRCYVYSRDALSVARADFPLAEVEGEGSFVYPAEYIGALRFLDGHTCTIEAEAQEDDRYVVRYSASNGAKSERSSFDPRLLSTCDEDLDATTASFEFSSSLLRESIRLAKPFLSDAGDTRVEEQFKALQIYDKAESAKGDGHLFASDATRAFYFWCSAFSGKHLEVHGQHLSALQSFLAKSDKVEFRVGNHFTFAVNSKGHVLGWPKHSKTHGKFSYYPPKNDNFVFLLSKSQFLAALQYIRSELDSKRDRIRIGYNYERKQLILSISEGTSKTESHPIPLEVKEVEGVPLTQPRDWQFNCNIDHLIDLVRDVKAPKVEFRVWVAHPEGRPKEVAMFRTVDDFRIDAAGKVVVEAEGESFSCRVTRFTPCKE